MIELRTFEAFAGYGSQLMSLKRLEEQYPDKLRVIPAGISEIDKYAITAYKAVHGDVTNYGDISQIDWAEVSDFDLFTYSFPCTDISAAGKQKGLDKGSGTRSSLLWECERAIAAKKPKYLLMENVSALVSKKFIKLFNCWQVVLQGYGYKSFPQVLNAKDYGVPQNRERIFLVSIRDDGDNPRFEFPLKEKLTRRLKDVLETNVEEKYYLNDERVQDLLLSTQKEKDAGRGFAFEPKAGTDTANSVTSNAGGRKTDNFIQEPEVLTPKRTDYGKTIRKDYEQGKIDEQRKNIQQLEPRTDGMSNTLTSVQKDNLVVEPMIGAMRGRANGDWYENDHEQRLETRSDGTSNTITGVQKDNLVAEPRKSHQQDELNHEDGIARCLVVGSHGNSNDFTKTIVSVPPEEAQCRKVGNIYESGGQNGDVFDTDGVAPTPRSGQGIVGRGIGSCNSPKVVEPQVLGWTRDARGNVIDRHPVEVANCVTAGKRDNTQNYVQEPVNVGKNCYNCCWLTEKWFVDDKRHLHVCEFTGCDIERALKENPDYVCENWCLAESRQPIQEPAKCNVVAMLPDERLHDSARRIYDTDGLAPTQNTQLGGGHETKIIEPINTDSDGNARTISCHYNDMTAESVMSKPKDGYGYVRTAVVEQEPKIIDDTYKGRKPREYTENAPAIRSEREGFKVVEQEIVIGSMQSNAYRGTTDGPSPSITAACGMGGGQIPMVSVHPLSHKAEFRGFDSEKSPALRATDYKAPVCATDGFRIRKLTPRECFRLMDVSESDIDKIQEAGISNSQQYKLAGNSIVVAVLEKIFYKLFINTEQENEQLKLF